MHEGDSVNKRERKWKPLRLWRLLNSEVGPGLCAGMHFSRAHLDVHIQRGTGLHILCCCHRGYYTGCLLVRSKEHSRCQKQQLVGCVAKDSDIQICVGAHIIILKKVKLDVTDDTQFKQTHLGCHVHTTSHTHTHTHIHCTHTHTHAPHHTHTHTHTPHTHAPHHTHTHTHAPHHTHTHTYTHTLHAHTHTRTTSHTG